MFFSEITTKLKFQFNKKQPFVLYHLPSEERLKLVTQNSAVQHSVSFEEKGFVFAPFSASHPTYFIPLAEAEISFYSVEEFTSEKQATTSPDYVVGEQNKEVYLDLLQKTITKLKHSSLEKVVISRPIQLHQLPVDEVFLVQVFQQLVSEYPTAFSYLFYHPEEGCWMGATPEQLISTERNLLKTVALAGTQLYKGTTEVVWENKEDQEQQYVVDSILEALQPFSNQIVTSKKYTKRAGNLLHLNTDIKATFQVDQLQNIVNALHPTPAVCGLPKEEAMAYILQNENYNRRYYAGYLGEINFPNVKQRNRKSKNQEHQAIKQISPSTQLFVNLRCMHFSNNEVSIYVGGGITIDSQPEKEWEETAHKSQTMLKVL